MYKDNKNTKKGQKSKKTTPFSYENIRNTVHENLLKEEHELNEKKKEFGYGYTTWEQLLELAIEDLDQEKAEKIILLKESYKAFQIQKQSFESTIYLEPSKLPEAVDSAEKLLLKQQDHIFQRSGKLVRITKIAHSPCNNNTLIKRSNDSVIIKEIDQAFLTVYLTKMGNFVIFDGRSGNLKKIDCPERISKYLIAKQEWNIPILTGIINAPTLRIDGTILDEPGYDSASGLLFFPGDYKFEKIPLQPTFEDAQNAKDILLYILKDFPFEDEASKSVAVAAILTVLIRKSINTAPLFGFTAPKMASGKSLLADVISLIGTGKTNSVIPQAENETEEKKRIMAVLIELDPKVEHPEERSFALDLRKYIPKNRGELVKAGLTILYAYYIAGKPIQNIKQFGRFEEWSDWVRSSIVWLGMSDPCESRKDIESNDPIRILISSFFTAWYEIFGSRPVKIKELKDMSFNTDANPETSETLREAISELAADNKGNINSRSLARKLALYKNRIENGFCLEQSGKHQGTSLWRVRKVNS